jgi:RNA polymerase sigma factor (sigma-70 family)
LVEQFAERGDGDAFAALVRRHGAMVLGVCRRIIRHEQDAEDVFQAVFLVLSRKAGTLRQKEAVGPWLFGVAHRLALRARQKGRQRQEREARVLESTPGDPLDELTLREARAVLDEELARLPERERGPLILCYLEGLTRDQAAQRLGCAPGTLKGRLERGRAMLEKRLARRGLGFVAVLPTLALTRGSALATAALQTATVEAAMAFVGDAVAGRAVSAKAASLAETMLRSTLAGKFAVAAVVLLAVVACGFGAGRIASTPDTQSEPVAKSGVAPVASASDRTAGAPGTASPPPASPPADPPATDNQAIPAPPDKPVERAVKEEVRAEPLPAVVRGVATAVDAGTGTLRVAHREGEDTFTLANGAEIKIDDQPGELARLPAGANVILTRFVSPTTAGSVQANGRSYFGNMVTAVDVPQRTLTIRDGGGESTFTVAPNALIWVDGKGAKLAAVPPGSFVNLGLAADQRTVRSLGADGPGLGGCGGSLVEAVDVRKRTIRFDRKGAPDVAGKTFTIASDAFITINGNRTGTLSDVPAGCYAGLVLRVDGKTVGRVDAQGPSNLCEPGGSAVKAVDVENGTITFDDKARSDVAGRTFTLAKDVNIVIDGKKGTLSALPPGSYAEIRLWVDRQTIGNIFAVGPSVPGIGVVSAVDAQKHTITIGDKTYPVAKDANIQVDGKTVRLAGVPTGISVSLRLNVDRKTVGTIFHTKP